MEKAKKKLMLIVLISVLCAAIIVCSITIPIVLLRSNGDLCEHLFLPATCQSPSRCVKCNATTGDKLTHEFTVELSGKIEATCFDDGSVTYECPNCHEQRATVLPKLSHNYQADPSANVELSCETDEIKGYKCDLCNSAYTEIIKRRTGHTPAENAVWSEATSIDGDEPCQKVLVDTTPCANAGCDEIITRERVFDSHNEHIVETVDATCVSEGHQDIECDCGELNDTVVIPVKSYAHNWGAPDVNGISHCRTQGCSATQKVVTKAPGDTITASDLEGEKVAIAMDDITFAPDTALAGNMADTRLGVSAQETTLPSVDVDATVYDLTLKKGDEDVAFNGGKMHVSLPTPDQTLDSDESYYVLRVDDNDPSKLEMLENTSVVGDKMVFETEHFSMYTVVVLPKSKLCAVIGHNFDTTVVAPTCIHDGLTVKKCRRCNHYETGNETKRLGHDMKTQVVAPTCVEDGYTINSCSRECGEYYITNRVTVRPPHNYEDTVVAPTCTKEGYTLHVCSVCKNQTRDSYVAAKGHSFSNGACSECGAVGGNINVAQNFYTNLIKSFSPANGYYIACDGIKMSTEKRVIYDISNYRFSVKIDENGNLVGKGEALMTAQDEVLGSGTSEQVIVMKGGNIYTYSADTFKNNSVSTRREYYMLDSQANMPEELSAILKGDGIDNVLALITKLFDPVLADSPTEALAKSIFEKLFDRTETDTGYVLTLNFTKAKELLQDCKTKPFNVVFDSIVGEGAYSKIASLMDGLPEKYTLEVRADIAGFLSKYNVSVDDVCNAAQEILEFIMPDNDLDIVAIINDDSGTIKDILTALGADGDAIAQAWDESFDAINATFTDEKVNAVDAVAGLLGEKIPQDLWDTIDGVIDGLEKAGALSITTDKDGNVQIVNANLDNAELDVGQKLTISGKVELVPAGDREIPGGKFERTVNTVDKAKLDYVPTTAKTTIKVDGLQKVFMPAKVDGKDVMVFGVSFNNTRSVYLNRDEAATYNGQECIRRVATVNDKYSYQGGMYVYDPANITYFDMQSNCGGYKQITIKTEPRVQTHYYVYVDANKKVLGWEFAPEEAGDAEYDYDNHLQYYYNPLTGKYTFEEPHKYVIVEEKAPESCSVDGYRKFRCSICGDTYGYMVNIPHNYKTTAVYINEGSTSCEDGVSITQTCTVCNHTETWKSHWHHTYKEEVAHSDCGASIYRYVCLCGEENDQRYSFSRGNCNFNSTHAYCETKEGPCSHGYTSHEYVTYTCSTCGFSYVSHNATIKDGCKYTQMDYYEADGKQYMDWERVYYSHSKAVAQTTTEGDITTEKSVCEACGDIVRESRYQNFTEGELTSRRLLYTYDQTNLGREYVYDGCSATVYTLDKDGNRTGEYYRTSAHANAIISRTDPTCTRRGSETKKCLVCGEEETAIIQPHGHKLHMDYSDKNGPKIVCGVCGETRFSQEYYYNYWYYYFGFSDLTEEGVFKVGYYMDSSVVAERIEFVVDYSVAGGSMLGSVVDVSFDQDAFVGAHPYKWGRDGEITLDTDELAQRLAEYPDYQTFSAVITFSGEKLAIQYALTFTRAEMDAILGV